MSDDALFDVFDQDEPAPIVEIVTNGSTTPKIKTTASIDDTNGDATSKDKRSLEEEDDDDGNDDKMDFSSKRSRIDIPMETGTG
ncbi:unnamed protein product, partial [Rotaria magnacalcarata]